MASDSCESSSALEEVEQHEAAGVVPAVGLDLEAGALARALGAVDDPRAAGIEDADADVGGALAGQPLLEPLEVDPARAEAQGPLLGVAGVIDDEGGALPLAGGQGGAALQAGRARPGSRRRRDRAAGWRHRDRRRPAR